MKINPLLLTKLLPATIVKLCRMAPEDVIMEHEVRIQELERTQLGLPPEPERFARDLTNQRRMEILEDEVRRLTNEIDLLKSQQYTERRRKKRF